MRRSLGSPGPPARPPRRNNRRPAARSPLVPRMTRRLAQLFIGLVLYGVSLALVLRAGLGLAPWDVLHQGLAERAGATGGAMAVSFVVLLAWIPLRQRPGFGTLANAVLVGVFVDLTMAVLGDVHGLTLR